MKPSQRRCRRPQVPLPRWQERPAASLGKVSWELSVLRHALFVVRLRRFPLIPAPKPPSSRAIPGKMVGAKARPQAPPSPPGSRYGFPPLPGETRILPALPPLTGVSLPVSSCAPCRKRSSLFFPCRTSFAAVRPSRSFQARRLCAQPAFFQPSRHLCAKKNDFVKKNANTGLSPPSLPDKSACSPPESPPKTGPKNRKNQEITDFFRQSALTSPAKHVSVFSIAAGLQAVLGITCGVSVTFERVFFHVQVHLCWEPPLGRY